MIVLISDEFNFVFLQIRLHNKKLKIGNKGDEGIYMYYQMQ